MQPRNGAPDARAPLGRPSVQGPRGPPPARTPRLKAFDDQERFPDDRDETPPSTSSSRRTGCRWTGSPPRRRGELAAQPGRPRDRHGVGHARAGGRLGRLGRRGRRAPPEPFDQDVMYLRPVPLSAEEVEEYYEGFSNDTLWPIYHDVIVPASFHRDWWRTYVRRQPAVRRGRRRGGRRGRHGLGAGLPAAARAGDGARAAARRADRLVQPHPLPAGRAVRPAALARARCSRASSAPTSSASSARPTPRTSSAPAAGCSGAPPGSDTRDHARPRRLVAHDAGQRHPDLHRLPRPRGRWRSAPTVIDRAARDPRQRSATREVLMLGVDRLDYTKGIRHRLKAYEELLQDKAIAPPDVTLVQVATPSRERVDAYRELRQRGRADRRPDQRRVRARSARPPSTTCTTPTPARRWRRSSWPPTSCSSRRCATA